jgi:transcriptional regulator with XRE-family HTH domain
VGQEERRVPQDPALIAAERSIGSYLARQRGLRGLTLEDLAAETRIPKRSLERLEAGAFDGQTDGFARGFVRTVAQALGLDPADTLARMLAEPQEEPRRRPRWLPGGGARVPLLLGAASLLLAVLALWLVSSVKVSRRPGSPRDGEIVYRPDPVRDLAADVGAAAPRRSEAGERAPGRSPASPD